MGTKLGAPLVNLILELFKQEQREQTHNPGLSWEEAEQPPQLCCVLLAVFEARQALWQGSKPQRTLCGKVAKEKGFEALHQVRMFMPLGFQ